MYNMITTASPGYLGVPPDNATATDGSMRPGPQATSRRAPTLQARHAAPNASGTEAQLVSSAPGQGRARPFISPTWRDPFAFAAFWSQPRGVEELPNETRSAYSSTHAPGNVAHLRDEDRLFRWVRREVFAQGATPGGQVAVSGTNGDTQILDHRRWVLRESLLKAVVGPPQMDPSGATAAAADDAVAALQSRENSDWFKPPKVRSGDVSPNCALVSQWEAAGAEAREKGDWVQLEVTVRELREQGAELFLVGHTARHGLAKVGSLFNAVRGKTPARHDPGLFIVMPARGKTTLLMRTSGS